MFYLHCVLMGFNPFPFCKMSLNAHPGHTQSKLKAVLEPFGVQARFRSLLKDSTSLNLIGLKLQWLDFNSCWIFKRLSHCHSMTVRSCSFLYCCTGLHNIRLMCWICHKIIMIIKNYHLMSFNQTRTQIWATFLDWSLWAGLQNIIMTKSLCGIID